MKIFIVWFTLTIIYDLCGNGVNGLAELLGRSDSLTNDNVQALMEIYSIYNRGYIHYYSSNNWYENHLYFEETKNDSFKNFFKQDSSEEKLEPDHFIRVKIYERDYMNFIEASGRELTDLFAIITVKFVSMINSIQFAYGYLEFAELKQTERSVNSAKLAFTLGVVGVISFESTFNAIDRILKEKYPQAHGYFHGMKISLVTIQWFIYQRIIAWYNEHEGTIRHIKKKLWDNLEEIETHVRVVNRYLRIMIFGETEQSAQELVNLRGHYFQWVTVDLIKDVKEEFFVKNASDPENKLTSFLIYLLREIDMFKAERSMMRTIKNGYNDGSLLIRPNANTQRTGPLKFERYYNNDLWK